MNLLSTINSRRNVGRPCFKILGYIIGSLQVNVPDETFSCHIRDIGSQSETTTSLSLQAVWTTRLEFNKACRRGYIELKCWVGMTVYSHVFCLTRYSDYEAKIFRRCSCTSQLDLCPRNSGFQQNPNPWWLKNVKSTSKIDLKKKKKAILKLDFQKRKQLHFTEENYLNYTKKTQFCMWQLQFS